MFDLALAGSGDFIVAGNRDLAGVSGTDLIDQRIRLRLKLRRGSWVYDDAKSLGSELYTLSGQDPDAVTDMATAYVRDALRGMGDEIEIEDVVVRAGEATQPGEAIRDIVVSVIYTLSDDTDLETDQGGSPRETAVVISTGGGGI